MKLILDLGDVDVKPPYVGDLARDAARDGEAPKGRALELTWFGYFETKGQHFVDAFDEAWAEFRSQELA